MNHTLNYYWGLFSLMYLFPWLLLAQSNDADLQQINQTLRQQQQAWNEANLERFMEGYWKSDSLTFIGRGGVTYGWQTTLENYKKSYPDPAAMGQLTFTLLSIDKLSENTAWMIGKWQLKRVNDAPGGYFTLIWKKINGKWVIVADHTS